MNQLFLIIIISLIINLSLINSQSSNVFRFEPIVLIEEPPIGTLVIDLANKLDIKDLATSDYKFRFYSPQSITSHYFLIDQLTGHVKTQRTLDREYLCETKVCGPCTTTSNCSLPIEIVATQMQSQTPATSHKSQNNNKHQMSIQKFVSFDVIIEDKNEFAPKFPRDLIYINVSEGAPANFSIPIEPAQDRDSRQTQIKYSLEPVLEDKSQNYFKELEKLNSKIRLIIDQSSTSQSQLNIIIIEPFDYELEKEVKFKILASDGPLNKGQKALTGSCLVVLKIIDINDNLPQFDSSQYEYRLDEDKALAGTRLIRVHASDKDDGLNGLVKYSLVDQARSNQQPSIENEIQIKSLFHIDELTGWISVSPNLNLDYEQMSTYRLIVKAQDSGLANSMPVYTNCIIYLNDINDNAPIINLTLPSSIDDFNTNLTLNYQNEIELSEWTMPNTFIAQILVTDRDSGSNGKVKLEINEYKQKTKSFNLDYENEYLTENDLDYSQESEWIDSNDFSLIHLFNNIYSLMLKQPLDREQFDKYLINITASDYGQPIQLQTKLKLSIKLLDENDNKPIFLALPNNVTKIDPTTNRVIRFEFNLSEIENSAQYLNDWVDIGRVKAIDYDSNKNALVTYELEGHSDMFRIDPILGLIQVKKVALDREIKETYEFNLSAKDSLNKETVKVKVNLFDLNDNRPKFEKTIYKFQIYENYLNLEKPFGRLKAHDLDKPGTNYSQLRFDLKEKNEYFRIDPLTGDLIQLKEFDYEKSDLFEIVAIVYDNFNNTPSLNSTCVVQFEVIDLNDNSPVLESPKDSVFPLVYSIDSLLNDSLNIQIDYESNKIISKLFKINASDIDSGLNSKLTYNIEKQIKLKQERKSKYDDDEEGADFFIESNTGLVSAKIDFKRKSSKIKRHNQVESRFIGSFKLNNNSSISKSQYFLNEYEYDDKSIGIYGLIVNISDSSETNQLSIRAYLFVALGSNSNASNQMLKTQINLLKTILNETKLNSNSDDDYEYEYESENGLLADGKIDQDSRFNRVLSQFQKSTVKLSKKKQNSNKIIQSSKAISRSKYAHGDNGYIDDLLSSYFNIKNPKSYSYLILFIISVCFFLIVLLTSLCLFTVYYKRVRQRKCLNKSAKKHLCDIYTDNLDSSKKTTLNTTTTHKTSSSSTSSSSSSASPSSLTSSELINVNSNRNSTDDDDEDSGGFKNLQVIQSKTLRHKNTVNNSTFISKDLIREEERTVLIVNTSSANSSNNLGSTSSSSNSTKSTNTTANKTNPLLVLLSSSSSTSSSPNEKKLIVASSESLSSINTTSRSSAGLSTSQKLQTISNSFKTFKNSNCNTISSHNHNDQELDASSPKHTILLTNDYSNSYKTMPINGYRNLVLPNGENYAKTVRNKNTDQANKQLNLPVNELFKRYELKKQATNGILSSSIVSSSGSLSSLNSLNRKTSQNKNLIRNDMNNTYASPKIAHRTFNLNPIINITTNNQNEIPDYFFKDEKEHKMFTSSNTNSHSSSKNNKHKPTLNLKQVVVDTIPSSPTTSTTTTTIISTTETFNK